MRRKHTLLYLLAFLLLTAFVHAASAESPSAVSLDTNLIQNGDIVYFVKIGNEDAPWTVLSDGNDTELATSGMGKALLYANLVPSTYEHFSKDTDTDRYNNAWADSYVKVYCEMFYAKLEQCNREGGHCAYIGGGNHSCHCECERYYI